MARANTFDLYVINISALWDHYKHEQMSNGHEKKPAHNLTQEQMLDMVRRAKEKI